MGHYTKAYAGVLAFACTGSLVVAVQAHDKASTLSDLNAKADRWETWARNEHTRDGRAYARYSEVARQYRALARQVERSQRRLLREIAATRSLHRTVIMGAPVVSYVRVRKLIPAAAAVPTATTVSATTGGTAPKAKATTKPRAATKSPKNGAKATPGSPAAGSAPAAGATTDPASGTAGAAPGSTSTTGGGSSSGSTAPPSVTAPVNTQLPSIIGAPQSGKTFSADPGTWTGSPTSFTYQWQRCDAGGANCVAVGSAKTYTCVPADIDKTLRVAVEATNAAGSATAVSAASPKTKPS